MKRNIKKTSSGFTIIELLVTMAIIAILIGMVIGIAGVANRKSAESQARVVLQEAADALEEYRLRYGKYPSERYFNDGNLNNLEGEALTIIDPWGRPLRYTLIDDLVFELKSLGASENDDADDMHHSMDDV